MGASGGVVSAQLAAAYPHMSTATDDSPAAAAWGANAAQPHIPSGPTWCSSTSTVPLGESAIELTLETRGRDHADEIIAALQASGYPIEQVL